jgi:hypothetical protein
MRRLGRGIASPSAFFEPASGPFAATPTISPSADCGRQRNAKTIRHRGRGEFNVDGKAITLASRMS